MTGEPDRPGAADERLFPTAADERPFPTAADERPHAEGGAEEWVFAAWSPDARSGLVSTHRLLPMVPGMRRRAWYWAAFASAGGPLYHVAEFDIDVRADPFIVKAESLWAEHTCDAPLEQWSIGNETYAAALDDVDEALRRAYGIPTPIGFDLEWYATTPPVPLAGPGEGPETAPAPGASLGYAQDGVVHGVVELAGRPPTEFVEVPARRWRRWAPPGTPLGPLPLPIVRAHTGVRAPFVLPDGTRLDWVLTPQGWCARGS